MGTRAWRMAAVIVVIAASCGSGSSASPIIERQVGTEVRDDPAATVCDDIEAIALGALADEDLDTILDELARIGALLGATEALPHMAAMHDTLDQGSVQIAHDLAAAAAALDEVGYEECEIPTFTAMYVSTSFASCFGRAGVAAGTLTPDTTGCETDSAPDFLPCFDPAQGFVPVDCRTGDIVVLRGGAWTPDAT